MKTPRGKQAFLDYYKTIFPDEQEFEAFIASLSVKRLPILQFFTHTESQLRSLWKERGFAWRLAPGFSRALLWPEEVEFGSELPGYTDKLFYPMSASSLLPVAALHLLSSDAVLDACAAPGGKAIGIAEELANSSQLTVNDLSYVRAMRLKKVLSDYGAGGASVQIGPAEKLGRKFPNTFDKILVDAPCSSEQHVWNSSKHLNEWSINRVKKLHRRQVGLVTRLVDALKPGGLLVYSTCAVTPEENEDVVREVLEKRTDLSLLSDEGLRVLPHRDGMDTMFVAVFRRLE